MAKAGRQLCKLRQELGMTMRDVERASRKLAKQFRNARLVVPPGRLSVLETTKQVPCVFRLYALSRIYRIDVKRLLGWYGLR